ncbi:pulcherriminic acid synthase [Actinopolyspora xinjiangensis]|uniref:Pulcherriminic acid synthase n=1 Tax=Actinopolyspora xinjiangensis TaxID=405564 RepID=A0A1H0Q3E1_9ACTN|nr:cytochrome P450, cyclodipeptide synthase-associated [Actinopolyspora xinjiangensis]SDP11844.1 pulcherriminic acid synthase [Actinopolyspora xinjiangensis]
MTAPGCPIDILSPEFLTDPYQFFPALRSKYPVMADPVTGGYFISRHADVRAVLSDNERFTTESLTQRAQPVMCGRVLAQMTGKEHTNKRKIVIRGISGKGLSDQYGSMIRRNAHELIEPFLDQGRVDLVEDFGKKFAVYVTLDLLDLPKSDWEDILTWHSGVAEFITSLRMSDEEREHSLRCSQQLAEYLTPIIERKRRYPGGDYMSALCSAEVDGMQMSTNDILALCMNILLAATEPADKTLALLFHHLLDRPDDLNRVRADRSLISAALAETLRYTPPVQVIPRKVGSGVTDAEIAGYPVDPGTMVFCLTGPANRDPSAFTAPDTFDIDRTDMETARSFSAAADHVAFGTGMHYCIGAAFARVELEEVTNLLLDLLGDIEYEPGFTYRETGLYTRGPEALHLRFTPPPM